MVGISVLEAWKEDEMRQKNKISLMKLRFGGERERERERGRGRVRS